MGRGPLARESVQRNCDQRADRRAGQNSIPLASECPKGRPKKSAAEIQGSLGVLFDKPHGLLRQLDASECYLVTIDELPYQKGGGARQIERVVGQLPDRPAKGRPTTGIARMRKTARFMDRQV